MGRPGSRLTSIDCLRGAAALAVVAHHVFLPAAAPGLTFQARSLVDNLTTLGFSGVWLFIVISGFCIHLRCACALAAGQTAEVNFFGFWRQRIRRLYPAYLVALGGYIGLGFLTGSLTFSLFFLYDLLSHLLMMHNLDGRTVHSFCGVFWTLALEEQLYLAYFLLLYLRRRMGWRRLLLFLLGLRFATYAAHFAVRRWTGVEMPTQALFTSQWFVWALGALAVEAYFGVVVLPRWCRDLRVAVGVLAATAGLILYDRYDPASPLRRAIWFAMDPLLAVGFFVLVNYFACAEATSPQSARWGRPLARGLAFVGLFSYSLYLTHQAVFLYFAPWLLRQFGCLDCGTLLRLALVPCCLGVAWGFFVLFEKPFMGRSGRRRSVDGAAQPVVDPPVPAAGPA